MKYKTLYILTNGTFINTCKGYVSIVKIGTTKYEENRKWDYFTSSAICPKYLVLFRIKTYIDDISLYMLDNIKFPLYLNEIGETNIYKAQEMSGSHEWYLYNNGKIIEIVESFLQSEKLNYQKIINDPYLKKTIYAKNSEEQRKINIITKIKALKKVFEKIINIVDINRKKYLLHLFKVNNYMSKQNMKLKLETLLNIKLYTKIKLFTKKVMANKIIKFWKKFRNQLICLNKCQNAALEYLDNLKIKYKNESLIRCLFSMYVGTGKTLLGLEIIKRSSKEYNLFGWLWIVHTNDIPSTQRGTIDEQGDFMKFEKSSGIKIYYSYGGELSKLLIYQINTETKPFILVATKQSLFDNKKIEGFTPQRFVGITVDECRHSTAEQYFKGIKELQNNQIRLRYLIGFDATPFYQADNNSKIDKNNKTPIYSEVTTNKLKNIQFIDRNQRLLDIFTMSKNEYFSYNYTNALEDNIILEPIIYIRVLKDLNDDSIISDIDNLIKKLDLPYKKGVVWTNTIQDLEKIYSKCKVLNFIDLVKSHSGNEEYKMTIKEQNYNDERFKNGNYKLLMICCDRYTEGSNIKNLDFGISIENQSNINQNYRQQQIGRIIRKDMLLKKKNGVFIEYISDNRNIQRRKDDYLKIFGNNVEIIIENIN